LPAMRLLCVWIALVSLFGWSACYQPVFFMHGITGSWHDFDDMVKWVAAAHPGTPLFPLNAFNDEASEEPMYVQIAGVSALIEQTLKNHSLSGPFHLVCHSQGALLCRTMLQAYNLSCSSFVSLSGPQMGQFGLAGQGDWFMRKFPNITADVAWVYLYQHDVQEKYSAANYWRDPHHEDAFLRDSVFLPVLNNETFNPKSEEYKLNFLGVQDVYLFGSPNDEVIVPWQSAFFGFYTPGDGVRDVTPMQNQTVYTQDYFGLRTLDRQGRLHSTVVPGVYHTDWLSRFDLFKSYIGPLLT